MRDFGTYVTLKQLMAPATLTTTPAWSTVDRTQQSFYNGLVFGSWIGIGGITFDTNNRIDITLQHCDDIATWIAVGVGDVLLATPDANGNVRSLTFAKPAADGDPVKVTYIGNKRYVRIRPTFGGTHGTGTLISLIGAFGFAGSLPAA
ncbi:MAG: hypothetical protein JO366_16450 [Methylobacteriaceae bacterium]|nr:hypothetical protein [Methylobacteriaceae bacterium]